MLKNFFKKNIFYIYLYIFSGFALLLCSHFSPLYKYNFSCDPSIYLTIGRGISNGLIPYKDLLDIKGPIIFFLYAFFSLMRFGTNYWGIFILEILALWISVTFIYKTILLISKSPKWSCVLTLIYPIILLNQGIFITGGEAEEFILPFVFILIFYTFKIIKNQYYATRFQYFLLGFSVGFVFWIKYTALGSWIAFYLCIFFISLIHKNKKEIYKMIFFSILGFLVPSILVLGYFIANHAFNDLIWGYFGWNFTYGSVHESLLKKLFFMLYNSFFFFFHIRPIIIIWILVIFCPYLIIIFSNLFKEISAKIMLLFMTFSGIFLELSSGTICAYYQLMTIPFIVITFCWIALKLKNISVKKCFLIFIISTISLLGILKTNSSIRKSNLTNYTPYQIRFAKIIQNNTQEGDTSSLLLDFNELDHGWYSYLNIFPPTKYFNKMNISQNREYKAYIKSQINIIKKSKVKFVICPIYEKKSNNQYNHLVFKNYKVIAQEKVNDDARKKVLLLKRK